MKREHRQYKKSFPFVHAAIYACFGVAWIVVTDYAANWLSSGMPSLSMIQEYKGLLFIFLTAAGLYVILTFYNQKLKQADEHVRKINRVLRLLSDSYRLIVADTDEQAYLKAVAGLLAGTGGYKRAWISVLDKDGRFMVPESTGECTACPAPLPEAELAAKVLQTGEAEIYRGRSPGQGAVAVAPVKYYGDLIGVIVLYSPEASAFEPEELGLIGEITDGIGYGVGGRRAELERRAAQEELKESVSRIRQGETAKGNFLAVVSHELRTPITPIMGFLELLTRGAAGRLSPQQEEYANIAKRNAERLQLLINDLIDLNRIESGRFPLEKRECDLSELIKATAGDMRFNAEKNGIILELLLPAAGCPAFADPGRLAQVLAIVTGNAIKFSPRGTTVTAGILHGMPQDLRLPEKARSLALEGGKPYLIFVRDNGAGLQSGDVESIFDKFYQVEDPSARSRGGLGIGLSIAKNIVELHGGCIWAESGGMGKGSTFWIMLPQKNK